ncbi:hypothetical protein BDV38DRAFT_278207 [Aspergillus pseudotamarii]|uniref:NADP-dependent oxidoreductase domain-containing protein n=1 Tax=Aspergillus pseudotamarii TaxID=132259 RepID=A0A5N6T8T6_ASPPS|nr:uncharacterized protein BDV38DRAFT_278207 [Aspergillus pseudotamarii]KAE8142690.1 hypothetical protein BDV38DRAFT_278207 [Aspergillus pseudotamarii]
MTISDPLPATGFKLLGMAWRPEVTPDDQAFTAMKAAITKPAAIWSSTSVYGMVLESPMAGLWLPVTISRKTPRTHPRPEGLSEVGASTMRRAHAVCPSSVVADEYSLWNTVILTNGAVEASKELGIPILEYIPLRCGFLTGQVTKREDIAKSDIRHMFGQFEPAVFPQ